MSQAAAAERHIDWSWFPVDGSENEATRTIAKAARAVANSMDAAEFEDAQQEGYILVATNPVYARHMEAGSYDRFYQELRRDLLDTFKTDQRRQSKSVSYEWARDEFGKEYE